MTIPEAELQAAVKTLEFMMLKLHARCVMASDDESDELTAQANAIASVLQALPLWRSVADDPPPKDGRYFWLSFPSEEEPGDWLKAVGTWHQDGEKFIALGDELYSFKAPYWMRLPAVPVQSLPR